jgi:pimeloyl-ACP methyl ester carboxylesterase
MKHAGKIALIIVIWCGVSTAAADIEVHCHGQGPLVYLIGGGPAFTTWNLQPIQQELGVRYRVCRWDMRGVGDNAGLTLESQVSALSQWLRDMHEVLPQQPVVLWGHSWGALQVLLFAKHHPERVSRLVLSNPVDPGLRSLEYIERKRFNHPGIDTRLELEDMGTPVEELHNLRSKVASYFADAGQGWGYAAGFTRKDTNNVLNVRVWSDYRDTPLTDADVGRLADRISGAIYCRDDVLQPESLNAYRRLLSPDKHHVLTGCAHFPWEENPGAYYRILFRLIGAG